MSPTAATRALGPSRQPASKVIVLAVAPVAAKATPATTSRLLAKLRISTVLRQRQINQRALTLHRVSRLVINQY
jgi:hypothetical protein